MRSSWGAKLQCFNQFLKSIALLFLGGHHVEGPVLPKALHNIKFSLSIAWTAQQVEDVVVSWGVFALLWFQANPAPVKSKRLVSLNAWSDSEYFWCEFNEKVQCEELNETSMWIHKWHKGKYWKLLVQLASVDRIQFLNLSSLLLLSTPPFPSSQLLYSLPFPFIFSPHSHLLPSFPSSSSLFFSPYRLLLLHILILSSLLLHLLLSTSLYFLYSSPYLHLFSPLLLFFYSLLILLSSSIFIFYPSYSLSILLLLFYSLSASSLSSSSIYSLSLY